MRKSSGLTQSETSKMIGIPLRTYVRYENEEKYVHSFKYAQIYALLDDYSSKQHDGVLTKESIAECVRRLMKKHGVNRCYLFGSYAKGRANADSDVDLLVIDEPKGLKFYGFLGDLEEGLKKHVDLLTVNQIVQNKELLHDILKEGIIING